MRGLEERRLSRAFFETDALTLAPRLLGKILVHRTPAGVSAGIVLETEAYLGPEDKGAHSFGGRPTPRTRIQYGPGGYAYVFRVYGMHCCFNVVCGEAGQPHVVLLRALRPLQGIELMQRRRGTEEYAALADGPGKLCSAMGIGMEQYGADLCGNELYLLDRPELPPERILVSPRVNIDYAEEYRDRLWRFFSKDEPGISRTPRRFAPRGTLAELCEGL